MNRYEKEQEELANLDPKLLELTKYIYKYVIDASYCGEDLLRLANIIDGYATKGEVPEPPSLR